MVRVQKRDLLQVSGGGMCRAGWTRGAETLNNLLKITSGKIVTLYVANKKNTSDSGIGLLAS